MPNPSRWDIFCSVVDNYGDAGVCWRLARQLASEHALDVTLWLDDLATLAWMVPGVDRERDAQHSTGVTIRRNREPFAAVVPGDVVIEAFGCGLPERYVDAMTQATPPPAWFILEYLSAESWVEGSHGRLSPHPRLPLARRFWFPGFTDKTGGLLRERDLIAARDSFQRNDAAMRSFWSSLGVPPIAEDELRISMFCYPNPALPALLDAWADGDMQITCVVPEGVAAGALDRWTEGNVPHPGAPRVRGRVSVHAIPFLAQDDYDRLLWSCALNFVRGEDSFVRAQWASRPLVWHIYPQADGAHSRKLDAFLERYLSGLAESDASTVRGFWHAWNGAPGAPPIAPAWEAFGALFANLRRDANTWARHIESISHLASGLVKAVQDRV